MRVYLQSGVIQFVLVECRIVYFTLSTSCENLKRLLYLKGIQNSISFVAVISRNCEIAFMHVVSAVQSSAGAKKEGDL